MAQEKFLDDRLEQMAGEIRKAAVREAECEQLKAQIASIEDVDRKLAAEIGATNIELEALPRVSNDRGRGCTNVAVPHELVGQCREQSVTYDRGRGIPFDPPGRIPGS